MGVLGMYKDKKCKRKKVFGKEKKLY